MSQSFKVSKLCVILLASVFALTTLIMPKSFANASSPDFVDGHVIGAMDKSINGSRSKSTAQLIKPDITVDNGYITLVGNVKHNNERYSVSLNGKIFPIDKGDEGDRALFGDLTIDSGKQHFKFIQLKVEKYPLTKSSKPSVNILLEHNETHELLVFQLNIKEDMFNNLSQAANINANSLSDVQLTQMIIALNRAQRNKRSSLPKLKESFEDEGSSSELSSDSGSTDGFSTMVITITENIDRSELRRLISDLEAAGYYSWLDYSQYSLPTSLFSTEGDFKNISGNNRLYGNGVEGVYGIYLTGISTVDVLSDTYTNPYRVVLQHTLKDAVTVQYDPISNQIKLWQKDQGMKFDDIDIALGKLNDDNVFVSHNPSGQLNKPSIFYENEAKLLLSLVSYGGIVSSVWDYLQSLQAQPTIPLGQTYWYPSDIEKQKAEYNNDVIRNISSGTEDLFMAHPGDFFNVMGEISDYNSDGYGWSWGWNFTYSPNF